MPDSHSHPGVFVEEVPSGVRAIRGVSTSNTAFVGFFRKGPMKTPVRITSFADFERELDGLDRESPTSYAIQQYFLNGGRVAFVVRVASGTPTTAKIDLVGGDPAETVLTLEASSEGSWGKEVEVAVRHPVGDHERFDLAVRRVRIVEGEKQVVETEVHRDLSMSSQDPSFVQGKLASSSRLVRVTGAIGAQRPHLVSAEPADPTSPSILGNLESTVGVFVPLTGTASMDGAAPDSSAQLIDGVKSLESIAPDIFNLLSLPEAASLPTDQARRLAYTEAEKFCLDRRAFLLVDIPQEVGTVPSVSSWMTSVGNGLGRNAAVYFPRLEIADQIDEDRLRNVASSGTMAGVYARTDETRGVWKAPAGTEAVLRGASVVTQVTDLENDSLNRQGVNVLRIFPALGNVAWGARTLDGADSTASEWKYVPVRRTALYIEESLYRGTQWAIFEPNDESLWAQIRLNVSAFMNDLFRQGAFQGQTQSDAYFLKCDIETTSQNDIDIGVVNILVGFAPLRPAEFVILEIQQKAGQIQI